MRCPNCINECFRMQSSRTFKPANPKKIFLFLFFNSPAVLIKLYRIGEKKFTRALRPKQAFFLLLLFCFQAFFFSPSPSLISIPRKNYLKYFIRVLWTNWLNWTYFLCQSIPIVNITNSKYLSVFHSGTYLKLHNIHVTIKLVKKIIANLDLSKASGLDYIWWWFWKNVSMNFHTY